MAARELPAGFAEVRLSYVCFARQRGPFIDRLSIWVTRHGSFVDALANVWSPLMPLAFGIRGQNVDIERAGPMLGGDMSVRAVRESWMWDVRPDAIEATLTQLVHAVREVAVPWFDSIDSPDAFVRECSKNPEYWRQVPKTEREALADRLTQCLGGEIQVPALRFLAHKTFESLVGQEHGAPQPPGPDTRPEDYEQVTEEYTSKVNPALKGTVTSLRRKTS